MDDLIVQYISLPLVDLSNLRKEQISIEKYCSFSPLPLNLFCLFEAKQGVVKGRVNLALAQFSQIR